LAWLLCPFHNSKARRFFHTYFFPSLFLSSFSFPHSKNHGA
jgi:hypothetical protein